MGGVPLQLFYTSTSRTIEETHHIPNFTMVETTNIPHGNRRELIHSVLPKVAPSEFPEIAPSQDFAAERVLEVYPIQAPEVSPGQGLEVAPQPWPHLEIDIRQI